MTWVFSGLLSKRKRSGILLLDPEEFKAKATRRFVRTLNERMTEQFAVIKLPRRSALEVCAETSCATMSLNTPLIRACASAGVGCEFPIA